MQTETAENVPAKSQQKRVSPRSRQIDVSLRQRVEALYKSGYLPAVIAKQTGLNKATIATWADRFHWREARDKVVQACENGVVATVADSLKRRSEEVKDNVSADLVEQSRKLRGERKLQTRAAIAKTIVDASDKLFGWDDREAGERLVINGSFVQIVQAKQTGTAAG